MTRILLAVDGTDLDHRVASSAHHIFGDAAEYLAVNVADTAAAASATMPVPYGVVYPYAPQGVIDPGPTDAERIARAEDLARRIAEEIGVDSIEAIGDLGDPADAIVAAAQLHAADVIVVGSHDRSWLSRLVSPSVSNEVVSGSTVPVLVVKSG